MHTECYYGFWICGCPVLCKTLCLSITAIMHVNLFTATGTCSRSVPLSVLRCTSTMHLYIRLHGLYVANVQFMWIM